MWRMMTHASDAPGADFYEMIKRGVKEAMPASEEIKEAVTDGVDNAMPYPSEVVDAIYQAHKNQE
jgi:hypothetical protein